MEKIIDLTIEKNPGYRRILSFPAVQEMTGPNSENMALFVVDDRGEVCDLNSLAEERFGLSCKKVPYPSQTINGFPSAEVLEQAGFLPLEMILSGGRYLLTVRNIKIANRIFRFLAFFPVSSFSQDSHQIYEHILNTHLMGIFVYNGDKFLYFNRAIELFTGFHHDELLNMSVWDLIAFSEDKIRLRNNALKALKGEKQNPYREFNIRKKDGSHLLGSFYISPVVYKEKRALLGIILDVTDKKRYRDVLERSQRMEVIGSMALNVYHDFNNFLAAIMGYLSLIKENMPSTDPNFAYIHTAEEATDKAAAIANGLLVLSRKQELELTLVNVNDIIRFVLKLNENTMITRNVIHELDLDSGLTPLKGDFVKLEQVILNVLVNALDAIEKDGKINIQTRKVFLDRHRVLYNRNLEEGNYIQIRISDNGKGISEHERDMIFDPFYTTKKNIQNTGLGLAVAYGIVTAHKGDIQVESKTGKGSTVFIYLPIEKELIDNISEKHEDVVRGRGHILVVEDDHTILNMLSLILDNLGYTVSTAENGLTALDVYERSVQEGKKPDLVILDLVMPEMDGETAFDELKKMDPDVRVLLSSGYNLDAVSEKMLHRGVLGYLHKPYKIALLSRKVKSLLPG